MYVGGRYKKKQGELECDVVFMGPEGVGVFKQTITLLHNVNPHIKTLLQWGPEAMILSNVKSRTSVKRTQKHTKSLMEKQAPPPTQWNKINSII